MTAPSPARDAIPGQRFTDPDDGTWVRRDDEYGHPWRHVDEYGQVCGWRSQKEAEAAGLVPLVSRTELDAAKALAVAAFDGNALIQAAHAERDHFKDEAEELRARLADAPAPLDPSNPEHAGIVADYLNFVPLGDGAPPLEQVVDVIGALRWVAAAPEREANAAEARDNAEGREREAEVHAAPAPLDPGNPEDWRKHAVMSRHLADRCMGTADDDVLEAAANLADRMADRLDREHAEAEQEAADRKRAEDIAKAEKHDFGLLAESYRDEIVRHILAGIRAERSRVEETKP